VVVFIVFIIHTIKLSAFISNLIVALIGLEKNWLKERAIKISFLKIAKIS